MTRIHPPTERVLARQLKPGQVILDGNRYYRAWKVIPVEKHGGFVVAASRRMRDGSWDHEAVVLLFGSADAMVQAVQS